MKFISKRQGTLLDIVKQELGYSSNTKARNVIKTGQISVDGKTVKIPATQINEGAAIEMQSKVGKQKFREEVVLKQKIVFEDQHILVIDKKPGHITKSSNRNLRTLFSEVQYYLRSKKVDTCLLVNTIDKKESGLVIVAKDLAVYKSLTENWKSFTKRHYVVIPGGMLDNEGVLEDNFHENDIGLLLPGGGEKPLEVELNYRVMKTNGTFSVIRVEEVSQIKNQIRAMFALLKNPIVGDKKYRSEYVMEKGIASHFFSVKLELNGRELELKTPIPKTFLKMAK